MTKEEEEIRRQDDKFGRKLIATLLFALAVETGGGLYYFGGITDRVTHLEKEILVIKDVQATIHKIDRDIGEIKVQLKNVSTTVIGASSTLNKVRSEQDKRSNIVYDSKDHMKLPHFRNGVKYFPED